MYSYGYIFYPNDKALKNFESLSVGTQLDGYALFW